MNASPGGPPIAAQPIPGTLDGARILDAIRATLLRFVVLPTDAAADAVVLWIAATHAQLCWACAPRLVIRAPEKRCGKSRLLDLIEALCWQALITVNASPAAIYRSIGTDDPPTLLIDESDTIFGPKAADANEDLRGLLNAGHQRNRPALRYNAATQTVEKIATFAMAALAGIGAMPDTIEDRAVVIRMRRRAPGEVVHPYRYRRDAPALAQLARTLHAWVRAQANALEEATPDMPLEDRAADTWEPLIAIADAAGGTWPDRARSAALVLTAEHAATTDTPATVRLLADCRRAFGSSAEIPTEELLARLKADPEAPWATWGGRPDGLTAMKLGAILREYDITSRNLRFPPAAWPSLGTSTGQAKGYRREDFTDAWERYCSKDDTLFETESDGMVPSLLAVVPFAPPARPSRPRASQVR